ncbi:Signal peptidase complex catalytic subunit SEC11C [Camellia lanceoleosa]|uniref:Signal peptidase complex catalytic subunit SEC11C n=1 Tax=Camellia lanceoleosa TaxID=1840588 RepID=A0ACC0I2E0_9ERIC|nr:Signal peptidase complex catalytic subunit SEC11C [Camellia lanceoleosa]
MFILDMQEEFQLALFKNRKKENLFANRGDILFLHMSKDPNRAGEIVVFNVDGHEIPIVHRVIKIIVSGELKSVYVRNLPSTISVVDIELEFKTFGRILPDGVFIGNRKDIGVYYAFVEFEDLHAIQNAMSSKPKSKPKKEKTEEERKFRRRAKYFLVTQLVVVLVFLSLLGGSDDAEVELDDDDSLNYNK